MTPTTQLVVVLMVMILQQKDTKHQQQRKNARSQSRETRCRLPKVLSGGAAQGVFHAPNDEM